MPRQDVQIFSRPLLRERTTIRLGGAAVAEVAVSAGVDGEHLIGVLDSLGGTPCVLGAGSNIIAADGDSQLVLLTQHSKGECAQVQETPSGVEVTVPAGMRLPALLAFAAKHSFSGLEGLCGIPGSVGGAVCMNAGSYGMAIGPRVVRVRAVAPGCGAVVLSREQLAFSYRHSHILPDDPWFLLTEATLFLERGDRGHIRALMRENYGKKQATQPVTAWTAGCVFKNPAPGVSAGKLLDEAGFRGKHVGGMEFSSLHANFLMNTGKGSFSAAYDLLASAKEAVSARSGYDLRLEVKLWE